MSEGANDSTTIIPNGLKVKVVAVDETTEQDHGNGVYKTTSIAIADDTGCCKFVLYDQTKLDHFKIESTIILRNYNRKRNFLSGGKNLKVFKSTDLAINQNIIDNAKDILHPPPSPLISIAQAKLSPTKSKVSIKGIVTQVCYYKPFYNCHVHDIIHEKSRNH